MLLGWSDKEKEMGETWKGMGEIQTMNWNFWKENTLWEPEPRNNDKIKTELQG
jgi:hypothetical protein